MPSFVKEPLHLECWRFIIKREKLVQNETRKDCVFISLDGPVNQFIFYNVWKKFVFDEQIYSVSR